MAATARRMPREVRKIGRVKKRPDGYFVALDAKTGALLWKANVGGQINAAAISYAVNGKQDVAINAGSSLFAYALQ